MMQLGIRFHDTKEIPFEDRLKSIKEQGFDSGTFWKPLEYFREKGYVFLIIALLVSAFSYCLSLYIAERKRGVI